MSFKFKKRISLFLILFFICVAAGLPLFQVCAQVTGGFTNPLAADSFTELIEGIIDWVVTIGVIIAAGVIVYAGVLFMKAGGKDEDITKARKCFVWALVGLAILLIGSNWVKIIEDLLGGTAN